MSAWEIVTSQSYPRRQASCFAFCVSTDRAENGEKDGDEREERVPDHGVLIMTAHRPGSRSKSTSHVTLFSSRWRCVRDKESDRVAATANSLPGQENVDGTLDWDKETNMKLRHPQEVRAAKDLSVHSCGVSRVQAAERL